MSCCPRISRFLMILAIVVVAGVLLVSNSDRPSAAEENGKVLRHVVMFQFKESSSASEIQDVVDAFRKLPSQIPVIADFEYGVNNSPEKLNEGLTHCFLVSFKSEEDRDAYIPHPAHTGFVEVLKPHLEKVMVIDYWANK